MNGFRQCPIGGAKAWPSEYIPASVAELIESGDSEGSLVEPLISIRTGNSSLPQAIWPKSAAVRIQRSRVPHRWCKRRPRHPSSDTRELPASRQMANGSIALEELLIGTDRQVPNVTDGDHQCPIAILQGAVRVVIERIESVVRSEIVRFPQVNAALRITPCE